VKLPGGAAALAGGAASSHSGSNSATAAASRRRDKGPVKGGYAMMAGAFRLDRHGSAERRG
jgi:hypothetical protein